jgi:hypothetical protein
LIDREKALRILGLPPVLLAIALQIMPLSRVLFTVPTGGTVGYAILFRWAVGASALLGSYDAVSGASTVITSKPTATGTNGVPFSYRITTGPEVANQYAAAPLPSGLTINTTTGKISGTPTSSGITLTTLTASHDGGPNRTVQATLTITIVSEEGTPPSILTQPLGQTVNAGTMAVFAVEAEGTPPFTYQWIKDAEPLSGATNDVLILDPTIEADEGSYRVRVSNNAGSITSESAELVVETPMVAPSITEQPISRVAIAGESVMLAVAADGTAPLSFQWRKNHTPLSGATSATLMLASVTTADSGSYTVTVSNAAGSDTSAPAELTVQEVEIPDLRLTNAVLSGGLIRFHVIGPTNGTAVVWGSSDLRQWAPLRTNVLEIGGSEYTGPTGIGPLFFRVGLVAP